MNWPSTLVPYHRTKVFDEESVPDAFLTEHSTADGAWAMLRVTEGELTFIDLDEGRVATIDPESPAFLEPNQRHRLEITGPVKFFVEFFKDASV